MKFIRGWYTVEFSIPGKTAPKKVDYKLKEDAARMKKYLEEMGFEVNIYRITQYEELE